jgi:hypothetical protein
MTIKASLWAYMDRRPAGPISGWEIYREMYRQTGRNNFPETLLKYIREYCQIAGAMLECTCKAESRYEYTPGVKISGSRS